jgi:hypothetical protein
MRARPPDGPPVLTDREVASSNTTLNAFLGGRQKSWMTGTGTNVRPTPRAQVPQRYVNVDPDTSNALRWLYLLGRSLDI